MGGMQQSSIIMSAMGAINAVEVLSVLRRVVAVHWRGSGCVDTRRSSRQTIRCKGGGGAVLAGEVLKVKF